MARIRSVHPDICKSETMANISASAERTFVRLWTACDDHGRTEAHPKLLKAALYPLHDDMTTERILEDIDELTASGTVQIYECSGKRYLAVRSWEQYQHPAKPSPSKLPDPPPDNGGTNGSHGNVHDTPWTPVDSSGVHCHDTGSHVPEVGGRSGEGEGERGDKAACQELPTADNERPPDGGLSLVPDLGPQSPLTDFNQFWAIFPKRDGRLRGKPEAQAIWRKLKPAQRAAALKGAANYALERGSPGQVSAKDPHRWLKAELWTDYLDPPPTPQEDPDEPQPLGRCEHCRATLIRGHNPDTCVLNPNRVTA